MRELSCAVFLMVMAMPLSAQAVRTWVSITGADTNPCTRAEPCRNFEAAVTAVADGGEVVALDSGGYGPVVIFHKSVALIAPLGIHAAIAPTSGTAIDVHGNSAHRVTVRGLYLNSQGAVHGINSQRIGSMHVERCVVSGFPERALQIGAFTSSISDTTIRNSGMGLVSAESRMTVDRVRITGCNYGVWFHNGEGTVRNVSVAGSIQTYAFYATSGDQKNCSIVIEDSLSTGTHVGIYASSQPAAVWVTATRSTFADGNYGVVATGSNPVNPTVIRLSECNILRNSTGVSMSPGTVVESRENNTFHGNSADVFGGPMTLAPGI